MSTVRTKVLASCAVIVLLGAFAAKVYHDQMTPETPLIPKPPVSLEMDPQAVSPDLTKPVPKPAPIVPPKPLISAEAYLVGNLETGEIYLQHNPKSVFPIASLSKLISALVALHGTSTDSKITITQPMLDAYGDAGHLVLGESLTVSELLYPLLLESSNDAAEALGQGFGYDVFIKQMNTFVQGLGMTSTSFGDASGLSSRNISNTEDLFTLSRYLYKNERNLLDITRQSRMTLASTTDHGAHTFVTINPFPGDPHFIGGKTGRTDEAKESMISLFDYEKNGITHSVAIIVLRSDFSTREIDTSILFEKAFAKFDK